MRTIIAKVLYLFYFFKVRKELQRTDSILAIYGHDQKAKPFEEIVSWFLKKGFRFITPRELYLYVKGEKPITEKLVWLSFDDGWRSNYTDVFPVLQKYQVPATIFVATKGIEDGYFWFTQAFQNRNSSLYNEVGELWTMSNQDRVKTIGQLPSYIGNRITLNADEMKEMSASQTVNWGNHTHDHVMSDMCFVDELKDEIQKCRCRLTALTGSDGNYIYSYPNGNYDDRTASVLREMNFAMAATTHIGRVFPNTDPFKINRNEFKNGCLEENIMQCFGIWTTFFNRIKSIMGIKNKK